MKLAVALLAGVALAACGPEPVKDPCENVVCPGLTECREGACIPITGTGGNDAGNKDGGTDAGEMDAGEMDAGETDAGEMDAGEMDAGEMDAGEMDAGEPDAGEMDAGEPDAGEMDAGMPDAGPNPTSLEIAAVRQAASDAGLMMPITGATVTYVKPAVGSDPEGFFIQAEQSGPALFVVSNGGTLPSTPAVGDIVDLQVNEVLLLTNGAPGQRRVTAFSNYVKQSGGNAVSGLVQNVSNATDLVTNLDDYESELIHATGTLVNTPTAAGSGHVGTDFNTAGIGGDPNLELRMPTTVRDFYDLTAGCNVTIDATPMWRFAARAQISAWNTSEITVNSCPAPKLVGAGPLSPTQVQLTFDRKLDPATVTVGGFSFSGGLTATSVAPSGAQVVVDTSTQTAGATYMVTVGSSVTDTRMTPVDPSANSATFTAFAAPTLVVNEVDYDNAGTDTNEYVELLNTGAQPVSTANLAVILVNGSNNTEYQRYSLASLGSIAAGEYIVLGSSTLVSTLPMGVRSISFVATQDTIQNGSPDAVAIIDTSANTVLDSLSYEGSTTVTLTQGGTPIALNEGGQSTSALSDSNMVAASICRKPNGADNNMNASDFQVCTTLSPGAANP